MTRGGSALANAANVNNVANVTVGGPVGPQEWLRDYFAPCVCVLATDAAEAVCARNNLTLAEMLQPFSRLTQDVSMRDPEGGTHATPALAVNFTDFRRDPARMVNAKLVSDLVASCQESSGPEEDHRQDQAQPQAPTIMPWYDMWAKLYAHSVPQSEHEFTRHHVAVVLAASSASDDPVAELRSLLERQQKHHQEKAGVWPQFSQAVVLRVYVLVHDAYETGGDSRAQEQLARMRTAFGTGSCHLLQINSRSESQHDTQTGVHHHWFSHSHRFLNVDARREGMGATLITTAETALANVANTNHHTDKSVSAKATTTPLDQHAM